GLFGDAGGATRALAQVVELRAPDGTACRDLDLVEARGVHRERPLHADAVRRLADRERLAAAGAAAADDRALEDLDALLVALDDAHVHAHGVAGLEGGHPLAELLGFNTVDRIHGATPPAGGTVSSNGPRAG